MQDGTVVLDVEIYSVGKQQLWDWCDWRFAGYNPERRLECYADSLAKGLYVVVEGYARFGRMAHKSSVVTSTRSLRKALNVVMDYVRAEQNIPFGTDSRLYAHEYEIWHIVDDAQLWDEWERMAGVNAVDADPCKNNVPCFDCGNFGMRGCEYFDPHNTVPCTDCGASVPYYRATKHARIFSDVVEYRCPTCERRFIDEDGYMQSPRDWAFHVFECSAPIRCACCGDKDYGPWVPYNLGKGSFYLCETCSKLYETLRKLGQGTGAHPDYKSVRTV